MRMLKRKKTVEVDENLIIVSKEEYNQLMSWFIDVTGLKATDAPYLKLELNGYVIGKVKMEDED